MPLGGQRWRAGWRSVGAVLVPALVALTASPEVARGAPPNDDFADAATMAGLPVTVTASNDGATSEPGEPWAGNGTLWWRWTAPVSGPIAVQTCFLPTSVRVYSGPTLDTLRVAGNSSFNRAPGQCGRYQGDRFTFVAAAGQTYQIQVLAGFAGGAEPGRLRLQIRRAGFYTTRTVQSPNGPRARLVYRAVPGDESFVQLLLDWDPTRELFLGRPEPPHPPVGLSVAESGDAAAADPDCVPDSFLPRYECPITGGLQATGPLIVLGDRDDYAEVQYSRAQTVVSGGAGDDEIHAGGKVSAGPGNDVVEARTWVRSQINGGSGADTIRGSRREDVIVPGAGIDRVDSSFGRDVIRARDGEIDYLLCHGRATALIDAFDDYSLGCGHVRRRGVARAVPDGVAAETVEGKHTGRLSVGVRCPPDGPPVCMGSMMVSRRGTPLVRRPIRLPRADTPIVGPQLTHFRLGLQTLRAIQGRLRVTVSTKYPPGIRRSASGVFQLFVYP